MRTVRPRSRATRERELVTGEEQLDGWVAGEPSCPNDRGECCPDFSCCEPRLLADKAERQRFKDGTAEERDSMLFGFLGAGMVFMTDDDVYVAGDPASHVGEQ